MQREGTGSRTKRDNIFHVCGVSVAEANTYEEHTAHHEVMSL